MRKVKSILICLALIILTFTGCADNSNSIPPPPDEVARLQSVDVMNYFKNKDAENLKKMFCKTTSETHNLNEEIREAFDVIDGKIISYDEPDGSSGGGESKYGKRTQLSLNGKIENIKTNTNNTYAIRFASFEINDENPDMIGIVRMSLRDSNGNILAKIGWDET